MKAWIFAVVVLVMVSSAGGQVIGLGSEEIEPLFGRPVKRVRETRGWADVYKTNGWEITVRYQSLKSAEVIFRCADGKAIDLDDREYLIKYLAGGEALGPRSDHSCWCGENRGIRFSDEEVSINSIYAWSRDESRVVSNLTAGEPIFAMPAAPSATLPPAKKATTAVVDYELVADVNNKFGRLKIKNTSGWLWSDVRVCINSGFFNDGYYYDAPDLYNGVDVEIPAASFATRKGERFSPEKFVIKEVMIKAKDPSGRLQVGVYRP